MGAGVFHGRVRDGIGCRHPAKATRSSNPENWVGCFGFGAFPGGVRVVCCVLYGSFHRRFVHRIGRCVVGSLSLSGD